MLRHALSRRILLKKKTVVKFYPRIYGYLLHEFSRIIFQMLYGVYDISFLLPRKRILNEIKARKILKRFGVKTTRIKDYSLDKARIEEYYVDSYDLSDYEKIKPRQAERKAEKIGKITRMLNERGYYFIDNRAYNWIAKNLMRTDLELFCKKSKNRKFFGFCDVLSFLSSVENKRVRDSFIKGYGKEVKPSAFIRFLVRAYIKFTDFIFLG